MSNWNNPGGQEPYEPTPNTHEQPTWQGEQPTWQGEQPPYAQGHYGAQPHYGGSQLPPGYVADPYLAQQAAKPGVMSLRPQNVGDVLDVAFQTIKANPAATFGVSILTGLIGLVLSVVMVVATGGAISTSGDTQGSFGAIAILTVVIAIPLLMLVSLASMGALAHIFSQAVLGHRTTTGEALRVGIRRMWSVLGASLLTGLLYLVIVIGIVLILAGLEAAHVPGVVLVLLGLVLFLTVFFFAVRFAFGLHAIVMESAGPLTSLKRSVRLTRKRTFRTFGVILLAFVVVMVVSSVVQTIGNLLSSVAVGSSGSPFGDSSSNLSTAALIGSTLITGILSMIVGAFTQPFLLNVLGALYVDARIRDEGLAASLAAAAQPAAQTAPSSPWGGQPPTPQG